MYYDDDGNLVLESTYFPDGLVLEDPAVKRGGAGGSWDLDPGVKVINPGIDKRVEISKDSGLMPGDQLEIELIPKVGKGMNAVAYKIMKFEDDPRFEVTGWRYLDKGVALKVRVKKAPPAVYTAGPITSGVIIAAILGITAISVSVVVYKLPGAVAAAADDLADTFEKKGGKTVAASFNVLVVGSLVVLGLFFWGKAKA